MEKTKRNIIISKAGGNSGRNTVNYKVSLPAQMIKDLGITLEDKSVLLSFVDGKIIIEKDMD
ncbi:TPA: AbrB/MazE/SpoVT family DNA-binding domain-containing protein [Clostridioides difficile]|nr:AbrB/MazE/SpoVT family DNA-binding domain-containing protein [Clostridioides difficile]